MNLTIDNLQSYLAGHYCGHATEQSMFMKLVEETGEVAEVLNMRAGRKAADGSDLQEELGIELADMLHYIMAIAAINKIDLSRIILEKDKKAAVKYRHITDLETFLSTCCSRTEEVELTNMCMISDGKGNVLVQNKQNHPHWSGWNFPGGHVEPGEYVTPSVIREMQEETGLLIENPRLCGIKEFHKARDGKRYIVFLYVADHFSGELTPSREGEVFWYPLAELPRCGKLIDGFGEMLEVFTRSDLSEVCYQKCGSELNTVYY